MTAIHEPNTLLSLRDGQTEFDQAQTRALVDAVRIRHATQADMQVFFHYCRRTGLDPFARQIYMIARQEWDSEAGSKVWRQTIQTGIDGFRLVARRAADRKHEVITMDDPVWFDREGNEHKVWLRDEPPAAARAVVHRGEGRFPAVVHFDEYVPLMDETEWKDGKKHKTGRKVPSGMWGTRPAGQLYKCAEAAALRAAFPQDLSGVYVEEEMERGQVIDVDPVETTTTIRRVEEGPTKRDWIAEIAAAQSGEEVTKIWTECRAAGERTAEFDKAARDRGAFFKAQSEEKVAEEQPAEEPAEKEDVTLAPPTPPEADSEQDDPGWPEVKTPGAE